MNSSPGQRCENCRHFEDFRHHEDDPHEANGYCAQLLNTLGMARALKVNGGYAGHWTNHKSWCKDWSAAEPEEKA